MPSIFKLSRRANMGHNIPFVVDLDGTLLRSDLLAESSVTYIGQTPWRCLTPLKWLCSGRAQLKAHLAKAVTIDVTTLPYDPQVISLIKEQKAKGRMIVLATGSHQTYADQIAQHLQLFDRVLATAGETNFTSHTKRDMLVQEYGAKGFDYVGNSRADLPVWAAARFAYVVNPEIDIESRARALGNVVQVLNTQHNSVLSWQKALRTQHWIKNLLIFVPLFFSPPLVNPGLLLDGMLAYLVFCLCASSAYIVNDLLDLVEDRSHQRKRYRPLAAGDVSIKVALIILPLLLLLAFSTTIGFLSWEFTFTLAGYSLLTLAYSLLLKKIVLLDVITVATLYTLRVVAGAVVFQVPPTLEMLAFCMFFFLSVALVKRYAALLETQDNPMLVKTTLSGYCIKDLSIIPIFGITSGYLAVLIWLLQFQEYAHNTLGQHSLFIGVPCLLLGFWISRIWLLAHRGQLHVDPVLYAIQDKTSLAVSVALGVVTWLVMI